jgi:transposase
MRPTTEREQALNMYFREGKGYKRIAANMGIPVDTVKSWIRRYRLDNDSQSLESETIKVERTYKPREKSQKQTTEERIAQLEMEVELLRNFLSETERRSIRE